MKLVTFAKVFFLTFTGLSLNAKEITMATIHNDDQSDPDFYEFSLQLDDKKDVTKFHKVVFDRVSKKQTRKVSYKIENAHKGFVLERRKGFDIITIKSQNFSHQNGGNIELRYLFSGVSGKYKSKQLLLDRLGDEWQLQGNDGRKIKSMFIEVRRNVLGMLIGVKNITFSYY